MAPLPSGAASEGMFNAVTTGVALLAAAVVVWGVRDALRHRSAIFLVLLAACLLGGFAEANVNLITGYQHLPSQSAMPVYSAYGRDVTPWVFPAWALWGGGIGYAAITAADRGWPERKMWRLFAGIAVLDVAAESLIIHGGLYTYFGAQPAALFGVPFVWPLNYTATSLVIGLLLHWFWRHFTGCRRLLFLPAAGGVTVAFPAFAAWPTTLALGADASPLVANLLGLASALLIIGTLHVIFRLSLRDGPAPAPAPAVPNAKIPSSRLD